MFASRSTDFNNMAGSFFFILRGVVLVDVVLVGVDSGVGEVDGGAAFFVDAAGFGFELAFGVDAADALAF